MVSSFVSGKQYGLLMEISVLANVGGVVNFSGYATGFNPNVDKNNGVDDSSAYLYTGLDETYSRSHLVSMTIQNSSTVLFTDDLGYTFSCYRKFAICFIFDNNVSTVADFYNDAFLISSVLMIYDEVKADWVSVPHVASGGYSGISTTVIDTARNAKAVLIGSIVRSDIAKVEAKWNYLSMKQYSDLAKLFEPKYGGSFFVKACFFDVVSGGFDCGRTFYCGDRKVTFARIKCDTNYMPIGYENVGLNLIER